MDRQESASDNWLLKRWGDSHNYELCIDSSMGVEETVDLVSAYVKTVSSVCGLFEVVLIAYLVRVRMSRKYPLTRTCTR